MANMVTRCPQCKTSFRITAAQLQTARGAVRCGACLHIFRAQDHLLGGAQQPPPASSLVRKPSAESASKPSAEPAPTPIAAEAPNAPLTSETDERKLSFDQSLIDEESSLPDDDDFLISDHMDQSSEDSEDELLDIEGAKPHAGSLFEREIKDEQEHPEDAADESWAMSLLEEEDEEQSGSRTESERETIDEFELDEDELEAKRAFEDAQSTHGERPSMFSLVEENSAASASPENGGQSDPHLRFHLAESDSTSERHYANSSMSAYNSERNALLMGIDPEPVEMNWTQALNQRRKLIWAGLALLAAMVLVVQLAWLQFDRLSRIEPYRSFYASICPALGCELPKLEDPGQIRATNVVVREHPEVDDALMVDVILLNNAPFEQPFPPLVIEFDNPGGEVVARRQFKPEEYLSGELAGYQSMPRNQPVHLTLELVDPGPQATGYRAYIPK